MTVVLDTILARVSAPARRPSRQFIVSLIGSVAVLGPFDGVHVHLRAPSTASDNDWNDLIRVLSDMAGPDRPVTVLSAGAESVAALQRLLPGLQAQAFVFSPGPSLATALPANVAVLFDPVDPDQQSSAPIWHAAGAQVLPVIGLGIWPRLALETPGVLQAIVQSGNTAQIRRALRAGRRSSAYLLLTLADRLSRRRAAAAEAILTQAAALDSPIRASILFELAETQCLRKRLRPALDSYRQALTLSPGAAWYWLRASQTAAALPDAQPAERAFAARAARQAYQLSPDTPDIRRNRDSLSNAPAPDPLAETGWWQDLGRQDFVAIRSAVALLRHAQPNDADKIVGLLEDVRQGRLPPDHLTLDRLLDCMADGTLIRLRHGTLEASSRLSLKVVTEEVLVDHEYHFDSPHAAPRVVDCGVNFGLSLYSTLAAHPRATILGFEPHPDLFDLAQANIRRNSWHDQVDLRRVALGPQDGTATLYLSDEDDMAGSLTTRIADQGRPVTAVEVETHRLSRHLDRPTDFLKIDIEGVEHEVLAECGEALSQVTTLFCEYHHTPGLTEDRLGQILNTLWQAGFDTHVTRSPWVGRKFPRGPGQAATQPHSLSLFACQRPASPEPNRLGVTRESW